ncbi:MAG: hypothetical protein V4713_12410 [Pseudomonadota bacterium]
MKYIFITLLAVFLAACNPNTGSVTSDGFDGTYTAQDGKISYTITTDGKIKGKSKYFEKVTTYTAQKNKIVFRFDGGLPQFLMRNEDGTVVSDSGTLYKKD